MKVYLAGPIHQRTDAECKDWRELAKSLRPDIEWLDPMRRDYRGIEAENVGAIVEQDKADILQSDAVLAVVDPPSAGTSMEIHWAWQLSKPVYVVAGGAVSPWIEYHATHVCESFSAALELFA